LYVGQAEKHGLGPWGSILKSIPGKTFFPESGETQRGIGLLFTSAPKKLFENHFDIIQNSPLHPLSFEERGLHAVNGVSNV